jgi:hypothetical protein
MHLGAELFGWPDDEEAESACWWDDPLDLARARVEHHWQDPEFGTARSELSRPHSGTHGEISAAAFVSTEQAGGDMKWFKTSKPVTNVASKASGFSMAHFLKLNGSVWSGRVDERHMDVPDVRPVLRVPLIPTRSGTATFVEYNK